jgi:hypothetical protein
MIARYNKISLVWGGPGALLQLVGWTYALILASDRREPGIVNMVIVWTALSVGTVLWTIGLAYYAMAKGKHPAWCIMGFFCLPGLIVLACLPDDFQRGLELRCKACNDWNHESAKFCNNCGGPL